MLHEKREQRFEKQKQLELLDSATKSSYLIDTQNTKIDFPFSCELLHAGQTFN